jgi:BASS family bile acid:Na+ symporter
MLGIGALLTFKDFEMIFRKPLAVLLGVAAQFVIMPVLALIVARAFALTPNLAVGLILAGAVPDAMAAGVISYLADANVAYSVSLTCGTTLISPAVTPWLTQALGKTMVEVQVWPMFRSIILIVIVPLVSGLGVRYLLKDRITRMEKVFPAISTLFIAFICGQVIALNRDNIRQVGMLVLGAVIVLNLLGLVFGYLAGKLFRFDEKYCRTLSINVAMQNAGLGAVLALRHISPEAAIPNALFATWCIVTGSILAKIWSHRSKSQPGSREEGAQPVGP